MSIINVSKDVMENAVVETGNVVSDVVSDGVLDVASDAVGSIILPDIKLPININIDVSLQSAVGRIQTTVTIVQGIAIAGILFATSYYLIRAARRDNN